MTERGTGPERSVGAVRCIFLGIVEQSASFFSRFLWRAFCWLVVVFGDGFVLNIGRTSVQLFGLLQRFSKKCSSVGCRSKVGLSFLIEASKSPFSVQGTSKKEQHQMDRIGRPQQNPPVALDLFSLPKRTCKSISQGLSHEWSMLDFTSKDHLSDQKMDVGKN